MYLESDPSNLPPGYPQQPKSRMGFGGCLGGMAAVGCLGTFLLLAGSIGFVAYTIWEVATPRIQEVRRIVQDCPSAVAGLGEPVVMGLTNLRNANIQGDPSDGRMTVEMTVGGAKNSGYLSVKLEGRDGVWLPEKADLKVGDTTFDLITCSNLEQHPNQRVWATDIETLGPELEAACHGERDGQACLTLAGFFLHIEQPQRAMRAYKTACDYGFKPACALAATIEQSQPNDP